jgi:hypothetical protein
VLRVVYIPGEGHLGGTGREGVGQKREGTSNYLGRGRLRGGMLVILLSSGLLTTPTT